MEVLATNSNWLCKNGSYNIYPDSWWRKNPWQLGIYEQEGLFKVHLVQGLNSTKVLLMAEIRRSPVEVGSLPSLFTTGFIHTNSGCLGFLNHQQYDMYFRLTRWISLELKSREIHRISLPVRVIFRLFCKRPSSGVRGKRAPSLRTKSWFLSCFKGCCLFCKHLNHHLNHPVITCLLLPAKHASDTVLRSILRKLMLEKQMHRLNHNHTQHPRGTGTIPLVLPWAPIAGDSVGIIAILEHHHSSAITTSGDTSRGSCAPWRLGTWLADGGLQWGVLC